MRDAATGRTWNVRVVLRGDAYGLRDAIVHDGAEPLVEFYDARYAGRNGFGPRGQFVARYWAGTLFDHGPHALCLHGGVRGWSVSADVVCCAIVFAQRVIRESRARDALASTLAKYRGN